ncbi:MAG TPA: SGNH/GDSL hydrolase family protein [Caulobacteraceae bacterium]|jgi:lysophospholipase L1-like esterase
MRTTVILIGALAALCPLAALAQPSPSSAPPPAGAKYVAMGSSFGAGPGITTQADDPPTRCARSRDNYAHQLARRHGLKLVDVTCSGATTAHILGPWNELKPQLDAVDPDTRLVTVTIGGNDVGLTSGLGAEACQTRGAGSACPATPPEPTAQAWADLETHLGQIAAEVHRRAPAARLVFVDYTTVLPAEGACPALSLTPAQAAASREINRHVVEITAKVARASGSGLLAASALTAPHNACSAQPWANGASPPKGSAAFHPRLEAHTAIAEALDRQIWR